MHENVTEAPVERQVTPARAAASLSIGAMGTPAAVIALQRSAGNRAVAAAIGRVPGNRARAALVADRRRLMRSESDADRPGEAPGTLSEPAGVGEPVAQLEPDAASLAEPTASPATGDAAVKCRIDSFTHKMGPWNESWPWTWTTKTGQNTTLRLPVKFNLLLSKGCDKQDCTIGQRKKGETLSGGDKQSWASFIQDGNRFWWDGANWTIGSGSWSMMPGRDDADFGDEPGFEKVLNSDYPLYWGGVGGSGCFVFETWVADKATGKELKSIGWNMRIDYSRPKEGSHGSCK